MKKFIMILAAILVISVSANARDRYTRSASVLPVAAQSVLSKNFKAGVSLVKIERSEFEVTLLDGSEISFDKKGNWESVEVSERHEVPAAFLPQEVRNYVKKNHKDARIVGIDKERNGYEVELSNGIDIKFDRSGRFVRYDD